MSALRPRLALMQPYFFPYSGYFSLIAAVDAFVVFDTAQYIRRGWCNRNRILQQGGGWTYITVPVAKHDRDTPIRGVLVSENEDWRGVARNQLRVYRKAPHYGPVIELFDHVVAPRGLSIGALALRSVEAVCEYVGLPFPVRPFPTVDAGAVEGPGDWGRVVALHEGYPVYLNAPGGREIYAADRYAAAGLTLGFVDPRLEPYPQGRLPFEKGLSILDVLMFVSPEDARARISTYGIDWPEPRPAEPATLTASC